jgi:cysteine-rich CPXCG protein
VAKEVDTVDDSFPITCPYCGEQVEIYLEPDVRGTLIQDCEVCCNPWTLRVSMEDGERCISVERGDGTE